MLYDGTLVMEYLRKTHETLLLSEREKHLVGLAVTMTRGCQVCTQGRIDKARAAGIGDSALNALVGIVSTVNAGVSAATAREGFRLADLSAHESCRDSVPRNRVRDDDKRGRCRPIRGRKQS